MPHFLISLLSQRQACFVLGVGGIQDDAGALHPELDAISNHLEDKPYPPISFISSRMVPVKARRATKDVAYCALKSLTRDAAVRLAKRFFRDKRISASDGQISAIVELSDRHLYNSYKIFDEMEVHGVAAFLARPKDYVEWKHKQSSEYIAKLQFSGPLIDVALAT